MKKEILTLKTSARTEFLPLFQKVQGILSGWGVKDGLCIFYVPHTTAGIFVNEGCDPDVIRDIQNTLDRLVPWQGGYHHIEGNSAAHIKATLVGNSRQVLVENGRLQLGRWEEIFFAEFDGPRTRQLILTFIDAK
ncbi:MAG TPA: secondary thiamine-phosphate synthase enzyme YjbQ [bacterium]|nr:secondary thiamine-phosphate synthase enzyme YjbQ [bacterium]HOL96625.1 secondary thiamine-phosphate synthase enzyme YjbQ [bacterium]HPP01702.1 secondary thiamine-phosphate synthase enzyme YjbQ [bacterium]HXK95078.1 secondary thiamine-phosphate synthase enzyme YjbQ [bacterium]